MYILEEAVGDERMIENDYKMLQTVMVNNHMHIMKMYSAILRLCRHT